MILSFDDYITAGGAVEDETLYNKLESGVESLIENYIMSSIPYWKVKPLEEYGLYLNNVIRNQVDFLNANGGIDCFNGNSDFNFKSATTSGFNFQKDTTNTVKFYDVPLSGLAKSELDYQLRKLGLAGVAVW